MKDSGIEWIGEIPEGWEVGKIKYFYDIVLGKMLCPEQKNVSETYEYYLCAQNITENGLNLTVLKKMWFSPHEKSIYRIDKGDILVVEGGNVGLCAIYNNEISPCYIQNALHKAKSKGKHINKFLFYWMKFVEKSTYINQIVNKAIISHYTKDKFGNTPLAFPLPYEQQRIADYLDAKCAHIDQCLELTRQSMEKLRAYKLSCITEAVTKGLDPDVPLKDSGVPWIGNTPETWTFQKLKNFFSFEKGKESQKYTKEYIGLHQGEFPVYSGQTENHGIMGKIDHFDYDIDACIFTTTVGAKVMTAKILSGKFSLSQNCLIMKPLNKNFSINLLYYILISLFEYEKSLIPTYMQPSLRISDLSRYSFYLPSLPEQERIAAYLDKKCARIDALLEEKQALLDKLAEYKKSLIFECVTGKREVPSCWNR